MSWQNENHVGDEGAKAIAQALKENTHVQGLYLVSFNFCFDFVIFFVRIVLCE